jgi:putative glycosidase
MIDHQRPSSHHNATQATSLRESKLNTLGNTHASLYTPWGSAWRVSLVTFAVLGIFAMVGGILFYAHQASEQNQPGAVVVTTTQATQSSESTPSPTPSSTPLPSTAPLPTSKPLGTATPTPLSSSPEPSTGLNLPNLTTISPTEAPKTSSADNSNNSSSDVVLTAWQCTSSRKLVFRASNGWDRNKAIEVARSESCARWE